MNCPCCHKELTKEFYEGIINFRCEDCGGRMMTLAGLRNLCADQRFVNTLWLTAQTGYSEAGPVCMSCQKTMRRVTLPLAGMPLELDLCCSCRFVWFDPTELEQLPLPKPDAGDDLPQKAKEILALRQIEQEEARLNSVFREPAGAEYAPDTSWKYVVAVLGLPVELDSPDSNRIPIITWSIAILCLLVFGLTYTTLDQTIADWGFIPMEWMRHGGLTLATSMFLHAGVLHLLGNLYFLLIFGDNVEHEFGCLKYLVLLAVSGLCASLLHMLFDPRASVPCIGASGFISGIIACYAVCFPKAKLSFMLFSRRYFFTTRNSGRWLAIPAWAAFALWALLQIGLAIISRNDTGGGIAYMAHIGGALPGIAFAILHRRNQRRKDSESDHSKSLGDLKNARNL